jgi:hypothetical protein
VRFLTRAHVARRRKEVERELVERLVSSENGA